MIFKFTVIIEVPDEAEAKSDETCTVEEWVVDALKDMYEQIYDIDPDDDEISVISEN